MSSISRYVVQGRTRSASSAVAVMNCSTTTRNSSERSPSPARFVSGTDAAGFAPATQPSLSCGSLAARISSPIRGSRIFRTSAAGAVFQHRLIERRVTVYVGAGTAAGDADVSADGRQRVDQAHRGAAVPPVAGSQPDHRRDRLHRGVQLGDLLDLRPRQVGGRGDLVDGVRHDEPPVGLEPAGVVRDELFVDRPRARAAGAPRRSPACRRLPAGSGRSGRPCARWRCAVDRSRREVRRLFGPSS